ncbi:hypothetical protein E2C01_021883 [Portunus trituberculatus]|uniref:Uncharacterized protein n=1 Tax=Portunus trituberculatus TaxID=210409 RepID=A0A5B7E7G1_PORTR|nr:hypothetical protein [Portunus trituberculatus]
MKGRNNTGLGVYRCLKNGTFCQTIYIQATPRLTKVHTTKFCYNEGFLLLPYAHLVNTKLAVTKFYPCNFFQV